MKPPTRLRLEPALHLGALVAAVVVHDQVHVLVDGHVFLHMIQEFDEFAAAVQVLAGQ